MDTTEDKKEKKNPYSFEFYFFKDNMVTIPFLFIQPSFRWYIIIN